MQERQVTIGDSTFKLTPPFLVMATQNPVEQEGTYPLPEAQVDRFMLKTIIDYPKIEDEQLIVRANINNSFGDIKPVVTVKQIIKAQESVRKVYMDEKNRKVYSRFSFCNQIPRKIRIRRFETFNKFRRISKGKH